MKLLISLVTVLLLGAYAKYGVTDLLVWRVVATAVSTMYVLYTMDTRMTVPMKALLFVDFVVWGYLFFSAPITIVGAALVTEILIGVVFSLTMEKRLISA
jgi:hypothetical protein